VLATWLQAISVTIAALVAAYSFGAWRRQLIGSKKAEVAEKLLACCYQARDVIDAARSPVSFDNEGKERPHSIAETEAQVRLFNRYWAPSERLINQSEFFAQLEAAQYTARAYFGDAVASPVSLIVSTRNRIMFAARMLVLQPDQPLEAPAGRQEWQRIIWRMTDEDEIKNEIDMAVKQVETICRPALEHVSWFHSTLDRIRERIPIKRRGRARTIQD
jgi:hypothetical protein